MEPFKHAQRIESASKKIIIPHILARYEGKLIEDLNEDDIGIQRQLDGQGDIIVRDKDDKDISFELKADKTKWPNIFVEEWSNKSIGRKGWLHSLKADKLVYHRVLFDEYYEFDWKKFQKWAKVNASKYPLKPQGKYVQDNDAWGYCVPIVELIKVNKTIGMTRHKL